MWDGFVEILRALIFSAAHLCGGSLGSGVMLVSAGARLALLPLTLRMARQSREQQRRLATLKPALDALQKRYAKDPARLWSETRALHAANGIRFMSPTGLLSIGIQLPLLSALFAAARRGLGAGVRFLWIGDLARPDLFLLTGVTALTAASLAATPASQGQPSMPAAALLVALGGTLIFLWTAPSTVMLSMGTGSLVSLFQNWLLARDRRSEID
jgi:YidC/Oxa1 family membrane protein insertase